MHGSPHDSFYKKTAKKANKVFILEGRPDLGDTVNTCANLLRLGIKPILITDNTASYCMYKGLIDEVYIFYYRKITGKVISKLGSLLFAISANYHDVPVFAYPSDKKTYSDSFKAKDIFYFAGKKIAPPGIKFYAPTTDLVSDNLITKIFL